MVEKQIVIIGGGITGLSAAWELQCRDIPYVLLEADSYWGGKVVTAQVQGPEGGDFIVDGGAESIVTRKPEAWDLAGELGMSALVQDPGSETTDMYVLDGGKPVAIPLSPGAFLSSRLLSWRGKLRLLAEPFIAPRQDQEDETLAAFASRRLGEEAMEKFIGPVLAGIYNTDPHQQSILTTSPIMREMEAEYGSLFKALIGRMRAARQAKRKAGNEQAGEVQPRPRFITFQGGSAKLVDALAAQFTGTLRLDAKVTQLARQDGGYQVCLSDGEAFMANAVILATPGNAAAALLETLGEPAAERLATIRHTSIGTISLFYRTADLDIRYKINGLMIPRREGRRIDAVTFPTAKMPDRAPAGYSTVRVFFGAGAPDLVGMADDELVEAVRGELDALLGIRAEPVGYAAFRWPDSFPQADVGHLDRVTEIEAQLPGNLFVTGGSYRGIGVPDCVRQGRATAEKAAVYFHNELQKGDE